MHTMWLYSQHEKVFLIICFACSYMYMYMYMYNVMHVYIDLKSFFLKE